MLQEQQQLRVAIYIRVSTDDQVEKYGIPLQKASIEGVIKSKGKLDDGRDAMILAGEQYVYTDEGISGTTDFRERPAFAKLVEDIEFAPEGQKPFDAIVVYKIDRFARRLKILLNVVEFLDAHDIQFLSANESIDTSTPFGKAILGIMGVIAELEIETTRQRTAGGRQQAVNRGVFMGQAAPYGYVKDKDKKLTILDEEARVVKNIFSWFVYERLSAQLIADRLTSLSILSPDASAIKHQKRKGTIKKKNAANFWRMEAVKEILMDRLYIGEYWYNKSAEDKKLRKRINLPRTEWKLAPYRYAPIVEPLVFNQAQKFLEMYVRRIKFNNADPKKHSYLLSGLLRCASCANGGEMLSWTGDRKIISRIPVRYSYYYRCSRKNRKKFSTLCTVLPIPANALEEYILKFVMKLLSDPKMVYNHQRELLSAKKEMAHLAALRRSYLENLNSIPKRVEAIRSQHTLGVIDNNKMMTEIAQQEASKKKYAEKIEEIDIRLGKHEMSEGYLKSFEDFSKKYTVTLNELEKPDKRQELINILHSIIERIIVYARPVLPIDSIAGRKKDNQLMPMSIEIILRLPEEILMSLARQEFGAKTANVYRVRESNPC